MGRSTRRLIGLTAGLMIFVVVSALLYQAGMLHLEGKSRTFWEGLEWAAETLSTTGYGADSHWEHPAMVIFVVAVQFAGVFLVFLVVPILLVPFLEERFERQLPRVPPKMEDHVVVYRYGPAVETLLERLRAAGVQSLVVETDETVSRAVMERNQPLVFSRTEEDALDVCRLQHARAIVANGSDEQNAALILRARRQGFPRDIFAFVEDPAHRKPMEIAGATSVYTPRHIVAAALAAHASDRISPRLPGAEVIPTLQRRELRVPPGSPMAGMTLAEAAIGQSTGAIVVGQWIRSRLEGRCDGSMRIEAGALLEIVGHEESLDQAALLIGGVFLRQAGPFLVGGFGEVGHKVHQLLCDAGEQVKVIERREGPGVDVVGNVLDPSLLEKAGLGTARAVVLALDSDDATLFATVIVRDAAPNVTVIARVNHSRNVDNIYRAGADFALSISDISGEMLSARMLGRVARSRDEHRQVLRVPVSQSAGKRLREIPLRQHGCSAIAIERAGAFLDATADSELQPGDHLYLCGVSDSLASARACC